MRDPSFALFYSIVMTFLLIALTRGLISPSGRSRLPKALQYGIGDWQASGPSRFVSIAIGVVLLGTGELVVLLFLAHPNSEAVVRLIAVGQVFVSTTWLTYLAKLGRRSRRRSDLDSGDLSSRR